MFHWNSLCTAAAGVAGGTAIGEMLCLNSSLVLLKYATCHFIQSLLYIKYKCYLISY